MISTCINTFSFKILCWFGTVFFNLSLVYPARTLLNKQSNNMKNSKWDYNVYSVYTCWIFKTTSCNSVFESFFTFTRAHFRGVPDVNPDRMEVPPALARKFWTTLANCKKTPILFQFLHNFSSFYLDISYHHAY